MRTKIILTAALLGFMLGACKKKDAAPKQQIKLLSKITVVSGPNADITTVTAITYDSQNRMIKKGKRNYKYDGDNLVSISQDGGVPYYTFTYSNGIPVSGTYVSGPFNLTLTYTVADGRVTKFARSDGAVFLFLYADDNLASSKLADGSGNDTVYGLDRNPYYNPGLKYLLLPPDDELGDYFSKKGIIQSYYQRYPFLGQQYQYSPDVDGYPKSAIVKTNPPNDPDSFYYSYYTFEYVMRDVAQ